MTTMNQSQYAQHSGVDRKTIGRWIKAGRFIVMDGDLIDVEASDAALKKTRDGKDPRASNAKKKKTPVVSDNDNDGDEINKTVRQIMLTEGADLSREEAARIRENYMALQAKLQYEKDSGQLIELTAAEEVLFNAFRQQRDAWLNWPSTFGLNWLSVRACSPTVEDESRIADSYEDSDQRRASVICPHCGHRQFLDFFKHVQWTKEGDKHLTKSAMLYCECCGAGWSEGQRLRALQTIRWHQTRPFECCGERHSPLMDYDLAWRAADEGSVEKVWQWSESERHAVYRAICPSCGKEAVDNHHAGYQASKLFSPWQKDKPSDIAKKYIDAKGDPDKEQAWWNTQMGLPHRPNHGKQLPVDILLARREIFPAVVPDRVALLTTGVDTQDDRFEITITGWGRDEESWSVAHDVIYGDLETEEPWKRLDAYLKQIWRRGDGRGLNIMATCMDSGGHHTQKVYEFAKERLGRRIWAIKGESAQRGKRNPVWPTKRLTSKSKASFRPVILGVNSAKDVIRGRLHLEPPKPGAAAAGYMHFPDDRDLGYFSQLLAERLVYKVTSGQRYSIWEAIPGRANEALDCLVYSYAALCGLKHMGLKLNVRAANLEANPDKFLPAPSVPEEKISYELPGAVIVEQPDEKPRRKRISQLLP